MAKIFIAATQDDVEVMQLTLSGRHELTVAANMPDALKNLKKQEFDLIMIGVYFDESRMFELLGTIQKALKIDNAPIICFSTRDTAVVRKMHTSIESACKAFGAWMYLDPYKYSCDYEAGKDSELLRIIERCLTGEERKKTQSSRLELHKQREELLQLRLELESEQWSLDLEDQVAEFRERLAEVLLALSELQIESIAQIEKIAESSRHQDRVSNSVMKEEKSMDKAEVQVGLQESAQLGKEQEIVPEEESKAKIGRRELAEDEAHSSKAKRPAARDKALLQGLGGIS
ncbi:MAG: hypothetical protein K2X81_23765 [Candidatus Obscuribacterales bacterium]|nr:hypothetical protein [Candidatus Obscuribacterales bacterium]